MADFEVPLPNAVPARGLLALCKRAGAGAANAAEELAAQSAPGAVVVRGRRGDLAELWLDVLSVGDQ